jgi:RimJ/RimL family protein N-acetyltransferase
VRRVLCQHEDLFGPWMMKILTNSGKWFPGRGSIIGLFDDVKGPIAACLFEGHNDASIMLHIATDGSRRWMIREFLWFVFYFPFIQLAVTKIIAPVESGNLDCRRFIEHIGFTLEATLKDCAPSGDLLIYTMRKDQCKWLNLRNKYRGKAEGSAST